MAVYRMINGPSVRIEGPSLDLTRPTTTFGVATAGSYRQELGAGPRTFGPAVAQDWGVNLTEEYSFQKGTLRIGTVNYTDAVTKVFSIIRIGIWEGEATSLKTTRYDVGSDEMIAVLSEFIFDETEFGLMLSPNPGSSFSYDLNEKAPMLFKDIPGVGVLEIKRLTKATSRRVPPWEGKQVRGGELFVTDRGSPKMTYLLVSPSALTIIDPDFERPEEEVVDALSEMTVAWNQTP